MPKWRRSTLVTSSSAAISTSTDHRATREGIMRGIIKTAVFMFAFLPMFSTSSTAQAQIRKLAEMNTEQIKALDKEKTVVILTGGIVEEHGPYLPVFSDGYWSERVARDVAGGWGG